MSSITFIELLGLLFLMSPIAAAEEFKTVAVSPGQQSNLTCPTKSVIRDYSWDYVNMYNPNAQEIKDRSNTFVFDKFNGRFSVDGRGNLIITGTKLDDAGLYTCTDKDGLIGKIFLIVVKDSLSNDITTVDDQSQVTKEKQPDTVIGCSNETTYAYVAIGVLAVLFLLALVYIGWLKRVWLRRVCAWFCPVPGDSPNAEADTAIDMKDNNNTSNTAAVTDPTTQPLKKGEPISSPKKKRKWYRSFRRH